MAVFELRNDIRFERCFASVETRTIHEEKLFRRARINTPVYIVNFVTLIRKIAGI